MAEGKKVRLKNPGIDTEGKKPGDTIEGVAEFELEEGDMLCFKKINGIEVSGYRPKPAENELKEGGRFTEAMMKE